jgi:predicted aminopeptidase
MRNLLRIFGLITLSSMLCSCALPFYWQAIGGQWELLRKRTPIEDVLADPNQDEHVRVALGKVPMIRKFAVEELKLPPNESYTTYVDLGRQYVVWNVIATDEFSVNPKRWCYPFTGCVAYRGFFRPEAAQRFRATLEREGLDTYLAGATAYSTLGYFADPILNTMLIGGEQYIPAVLFHELAHQRLYVKDDSGLSEAFATAVEEYGTERWLEIHASAEAVADYRRRTLYRAQFAELVARQQNRLREAFARSAPPETKRTAKDQAYATMREEYESLKESWGGATDYDRWFAQPLNNAMLASVATYRRWLPTLKTRLERVGPERFYADMDELAAMTAIGRQLRLEAWDAERELPPGQLLTGT